MSTITNVVGAVIGFAAIKRILDTQPPAVKPTPVPTGFTLGPAAPKMDFTLFPKIKITPEQLALPIPTAEQQAFTRERLLAPSGTPEQAKMLIESGAIRQGKVTPLGYRKGETTDDLLRRLFNNPK